MKSRIRRRSRNLPQWPLLLLIPVIFMFLWSGTRINEGGFGGEVKDHLFPYDPTFPTNYSGAHEGWKQTMSRAVAERLNNKVNGFFVECGALDGIYLSNTLLLEMMYNWSGLLVEADPASASLLKARNRQAWVADVCLSSKPVPMQVEMIGHRNMFELSYIENNVIDRNRERKFAKGFDRRTQVQCYPLAMLMAALNRTKIDYFSLDVEGLELDILMTIPFDRIHIQLISVEVRRTNKQKIKDFLESRGYKRIKEINSTTEFIHDDLYEFQGIPSQLI